MASVIEYAKEGNFSKLSDALSVNKYSDKEIDEAFRTLLHNYKKEKDSYYNSFKLLIKYANVNYQNPSYDNTTILIETVNLCLFYQCEKLIQYFKYSGGESKLNVNIYDNKGESILFKLINCKEFKSEDNRYELYQELITENPDITHCNNEGHSLLSLALLNGEYFIVENLLKLNFDMKHIVESTGDTLTHCAIKGGNVLCLKLIKNRIDRCIRNKEGKTAEELAKCLNNKNIIELLSSNEQMNQKELLDEFAKGNYIKILNQLSNEEKNDLRLQWNNLLVEYMIEYNRNDMTNSERKSIAMSFHNKIVSFFKINEDKLSYDQPIINMNNILLKFKLGNLSEVETLFDKFRDKFLGKPQEERNLFFFWICFININLLLLSEYINCQRISKANAILTKINNFIQINQRVDTNDDADSYYHSIVSYLNSNETINQTNDLDEILHIFKSYKLLSEGDTENASLSLKQYKSQYLSKEKKFSYQNTLTSMYNYLKIKLYYQKGKNEKLIKRLSSLHDSNNEHDIIFYYHTLGVFSMKRGMFTYAEFCFKQCEHVIKTGKKKDLIVQNITDFMPCVWYNIALCYFYNKKYEKSLKIFNYCKTFNKCKDNPCLYFRIGICILDKELQSMKKDSIENSSNDLVAHYTQCDPPFRRRILLRTKDPELSINENINEAISNFKEAIFLFNEEKSPQNFLIEIFNSSYINLLFALTLTENWNDILFYSNEYKKSSFFISSNSPIVNNYIIQAYVNLDMIDKAIEILRKDLDAMTNINFDFYSNVIHVDYPNVDCKIAFYVNFIALNLLKGNFNVESSIRSIVKLQKEKSNGRAELPVYIRSIILYYFLINKKTAEAALLVKTRAIPEMFK